MIDKKINRDLSPLENGLSQLFLKRGWQVSKPFPADFDCLDLRGKVIDVDGEKKAEIIVDANFLPKIDWNLAKLGLHGDLKNYFNDNLEDIVNGMDVNRCFEVYAGEYSGKEGLGRVKYKVKNFYEKQGPVVAEKIVRLECNFRTMQAVFLARLPEYTDAQKADLPDLLEKFIKDWDDNTSPDDKKLELEERRRIREICNRSKIIAKLRWQVEIESSNKIDQKEAGKVLRMLRQETGQESIRVLRNRWTSRTNDLMRDISLVTFNILQDRQLISSTFMDKDRAKIEELVDELNRRKSENKEVEKVSRRWTELYMKISQGGLANINRSRLSNLLNCNTARLIETEVLDLIAVRISEVGTQLARKYDYELIEDQPGYRGNSMLELESEFIVLRHEINNKFSLSHDVRLALSGLEVDNLYRQNLENIWRSDNIRDIDALILRDYVIDEIKRAYFEICGGRLPHCQYEFLEKIFPTEAEFEEWRRRATEVNFDQRRLRNQLIDSFKQMALRMAPDLAKRDLSPAKRYFVNNMVNDYQEFKRLSKIFT